MKDKMGRYFHRKAEEIMTLFAITQDGLDQSFSSSNSTEISIRRFYVQNFGSIGQCCQELSCIRPAGRPDTLTDSRVSSLFEYTTLFEYTKRSSRSATNLTLSFSSVHNSFIILFEKRFTLQVLRRV